MPPIIRIGGILSTERKVFRAKDQSTFEFLFSLISSSFDVHVRTQVVHGRQCEDKNT